MYKIHLVGGQTIWLLCVQSDSVILCTGAAFLLTLPFINSSYGVHTSPYISIMQLADSCCKPMLSICQVPMFFFFFSSSAQILPFFCSVSFPSDNASDAGCFPLHKVTESCSDTDANIHMILRTCNSGCGSSSYAPLVIMSLILT